MVGFGFRVPVNTPAQWWLVRGFAFLWLAGVLFGCVAVGLGVHQQSRQLTGTATVLAIDSFSHGEFFDAVVETADGREVVGTGSVSDFWTASTPVVGDEVQVAYSPQPPRKLTPPTTPTPAWVFPMLAVMVVAGVAFNYGVWTGRSPFALFRRRPTGSPRATP